MLSSDDVFQPAKTTTLLAQCCYCQFVLQTHWSSNQCAVYTIYKSNSEQRDLEKLLLPSFHSTAQWAQSNDFAFEACLENGSYYSKEYYSFLIQLNEHNISNLDCEHAVPKLATYLQQHRFEITG